MILKQRFAEGRTNYIDIGSDWLYIQRDADVFKKEIDEHFINPQNAAGCIGLIRFNQRVEPIYKDFSQWIYSNDGQIFMNLT
jgi:hypothetical protein